MSTKYSVSLNDDHKYEISVEKDGALSIGGKPVSIDAVDTGRRKWNVIHENISYNVELLDYREKEKLLVLGIGDEVFECRIETELDLLLHQLGMESGASAKMGDVKAPMPGLVLEVLVEAGSGVDEGDPLIILEAMKMENVIKATGKGVVRSVLVGNQDAVEKNQVLIEME